MSVLSKFMLRRGWIQLSRYGLAVSETGQIRGIAALAPAPQLPRHLSPPPLPQIAAPQPEQPQVAKLETIQDVVDDDRVWQAAMAKAKAQSNVELGVADTASFLQMPAEVPEPAPELEPMITEVAAEPEEDWAALMAAANARAEEAEVPALADFVAAPPAPGAQVEQDATPANDDMPAELVTSIHHRRLALPSTSVGISSPVSDEDDWAKLRADVEEKANAEMQRKRRAMREIQRLQNTSPRSSVGAPPRRRRMAAGTANVPRQVAAPSTNFATRPQSPREDTQLEETTQVEDTTRVDLPRITQRMS